MKCKSESSHSSYKYNLRKMVSSHFAALLRCNKQDCCSPQGELWDLEGFFIRTNEFFFLAHFFFQRSSEKKLWGEESSCYVGCPFSFLSWDLVWS